MGTAARTPHPGCDRGQSAVDGAASALRKSDAGELMLLTVVVIGSSEGWWDQGSSPLHVGSVLERRGR